MYGSYAQSNDMTRVVQSEQDRAVYIAHWRLLQSTLSVASGNLRRLVIPGCGLQSLGVDRPVLDDSDVSV